MSRVRRPRQSAASPVPNRQRPKGIYVLPSLFTTASLFAGFYGIAAAINGNFDYACPAIFVAMLLDSIDGRVARLTHTESEFGFHYDSLVDMVSFGLAPALIMYHWSLSGLGKLGWLAAFIYAAATGLRLAKFNALASAPNADKRYFRGLPSPSAAALVVGFVWVLNAQVMTEYWDTISYLALVVTVLAGTLMVSNVRYRSFKDLDLRGRLPFVAVMILPLIFVLVSQHPPRVLFAIFLAYAASGPIGWVYRMLWPATAPAPEKTPPQKAPKAPPP
jgi:CDP-diacylglycerol---serine O-phosphatidyltransferase